MFEFVKIPSVELTTLWALGFSSMISRIPSDNLGVAILSNDAISGGLIMQIIRYRLLDEALGLEPIDWNSRFIYFPRRRVRTLRGL
jgi:hypothetical protein